MAAAIEITLGDHKLKVRPLTIGQIERISPRLARAADRTGAETITASIEILSEALMRDHPQWTVENLRNVEATAAEIQAATSAILELSGFVRQGEAKAGSAL